MLRPSLLGAPPSDSVAQALLPVQSCFFCVPLFSGPPDVPYTIRPLSCPPQMFQKPQMRPR
jgi:hypothetical protein